MWSGRGLTPHRRAWSIAWSLAVTQTVGFGVLFYAFSVFTLPMERELGWTRTQTSGAFSVALLVSGLAAAPVGRWVDAHGARGLMSVASALGAGLVFAWSFVTHLPALYAVQVGIGLVMAATLYEVAFATVARWFRSERIRALMVVTLVAGLASTLFVPAATALVEAFGWRMALRVLASILLVGTVPLHALALRRPPAAPEPGDEAGADDPHGPVDGPAGAPHPLRSRRFWWLTLAFGANRAVTVAFAAHAVPLFLERGHGPGTAAAAAGAIGLVQVGGRLLFGPVAERAPLGRLTSLTYGLHALALAGLLLVPGPTGLWGFAACFGLANGASTLARAGLVAEVFGTARYGTINGGITTLTAGAQTLAPLAVGALHVHFGGYEPAMWGLAAIALVAAASVTRAVASTPPSKALARYPGGDAP